MKSKSPGSKPRAEKVHATRGTMVERKRADKVLRQSEQRYRAMFSAMLEGFCIIEVLFDADKRPIDYRFLEVNPAFDAQTGLKDAQGKRMRELAPEHEAHWFEIYGKVALTGKPARFVNEAKALNRWYDVSAYRVGGPSSRRVAILFNDITERVKAEEALTKSRRLLTETEEIGKVGGWEIDLDTMKLTWTPEIYCIHEVDLTFEPTVEKAIQFYAPASRQGIARLVRRAIEHGASYDVELEIITAKGHLRSVHSIGRADPEHRRVYGFFQDITAQKQDEREMAQLRLELIHLTRVLTLNEISSSLAHEVNQPLAAILSNAEAARSLLSQAQDKLEEIPKIVEDIIQDAKRAGDVVRKVRTLAKNGDTQFEPLLINALIDDTLALLHSSLVMNNVKLQLDLEPDLPNIRGDRVRLQQVLLNLMTNALDSMKETPSSILTVRSAMDSPDTVTVSVSDSGPGIGEVRRASVFQPFFTTKKDGLGLGLSICRSIIEEHGGRIWHEDNPAGGATFKFSLKTLI